MDFELFDRQAETTIREGTLPHWFQPGVTYFITFRTEDSVPQSSLRSWHGRRDGWLRRHGIDPQMAAWKALLHRSPELEREYHQTFTREFMEYLDRGHGACALRQPALSQIVADSLLSFDGERYLMGDFIVMPNHVHLLSCLLGATEIEPSASRGRDSPPARLTARWGAAGGSGKRRVSIIWCAVLSSSITCGNTSPIIRSRPDSRQASIFITVGQSSRHTPCAVSCSAI
jgi:hypothetical protein